MHKNGRNQRLGGIALLFCLAGTACNDEGFTVQYAPDFQRQGTSVSVFGIFKDGRMSAEAWDAIGPRLTAPLKGNPCEVAYGASLLTGSPDLANAIDDYTRANGVTDDLLEQFATTAKGDTILLITVAGHPPHAIGDGGAASAASAPVAARVPSMRGGRRGRGAMPSGPGEGLTDRSVFEVSASLYSVRQHRSVAALSMAYKGPSVDEALRKFADKMATEWPSATCSGWREDARPDGERIQKLRDE
jgi:hypothetical protein